MHRSVRFTFRKVIRDAACACIGAPTLWPSNKPLVPTANPQPCARACVGECQHVDQGARIRRCITIAFRVRHFHGHNVSLLVLLFGMQVHPVQ